MNRRSIATIALAAPLAACAMSYTTEATVQQAINRAESVLNFLGPIVPILSAFVPSAAAYVPAVQNGLTIALGALNDLSASMTVAQSQPVVGRIATYTGNAIKTAQSAVALIPDAKQRAVVTGLLGEAQTIVALLAQFATGAVGANVSMTPNMYIRRV